MRSFQLRCAPILFLLFSSAVSAQQSLMFDCEIDGSDNIIKVFINLEEEFVIYNVQDTSNLSRVREIPNRDTGRTTRARVGIDISSNNSSYIMANGINSAFLLIKSDTTFAYAAVYPNADGAGNITAATGSAEGRCSLNPFN